MIADLVAWARLPETTDGYQMDLPGKSPLRAASEGIEDEKMLRLLPPMLTRFFKAAGVERDRISSRGAAYSILCRRPSNSPDGATVPANERPAATPQVRLRSIKESESPRAAAKPPVKRQ